MSRILGIVGGTGPQSTMDYYRELVSGWRERGPAGTYPQVIINSVEGGRIIELLGRGDLAAVAVELSVAVRQLAAAGAGAALLAANGTHLAFEAITAASPIPLMHIVDAARDEARKRGHLRLGLFGARFVMEAPLYPDRFATAASRSSCRRPRSGATSMRSTWASSCQAPCATKPETDWSRSQRRCATETPSMG